MAKRRMLAWMRDKLLAHAKEAVSPAAELKVTERAYEKAAEMMTEVIHKRFPPRDMAILRKYGVGELVFKPRLQFGTGEVKQFVFKDEDAIWVPDDHLLYQGGARVGEAVLAWAAAVEAYEAERKRRIKAYEALIFGASYLEDLLEVWPEARGVIPAGALPLALGPEQIELVKADQKERRVAA